MREPAGEGKKGVALICTVWGASFLEVFCDYSLASLLAPGNLPWASTNYDLTFLIYATEADVARLQAHENVRRVAELVDVKFVLLETLPAAARSGHWIQWQHAVLRAGDFSAFILVIPDCVYANTLLQKVLRALATSDIIYYSLPQVCLEPIVPRLRSERTQAQSCSVLDLTENQIVSLFVEYINPKHAVAIYKPDYFVSHPEYVLAVRKGQLELTELACHPLAIGARATSLSYSFNPADQLPRIAYLEILGISCEFTLKYFEQYFHWRSDRMDLSRCSNLASWDFTFCERGTVEYARTKTDVALSGLEALSQRRTEVTRPQVVYANAVARYQAALFSLYSVAGNCEKGVRQFIALAMHLPGFRKVIMRETGPLTIMLPLCNEPVEALDRLYSLRKPDLLVKFLLMHLLRGNPLLKVGQHFALDVSKRDGQTRLQVIDSALAPYLTGAITGTVVSQPVYVTRDIVAYMTRLNYGLIDALVKCATSRCV